MQSLSSERRHGLEFAVDEMTSVSGFCIAKPSRKSGLRCAELWIFARAIVAAYSYANARLNSHFWTTE
jgi:hypothetical protein